MVNRMSSKNQIANLLSFDPNICIFHRFHSLHHTQFRTNYSLFMPFYDYIYGTLDKSSDELYLNTLTGKEVAPHVVHLTHPTTLLSFYHLRLGFASLASTPYGSTWYTWLTWPLSWLSLVFTWILGSAFTIERNKMDKLELQTWAIPRCSFQVGQEDQISLNPITA